MSNQGRGQAKNFPAGAHSDFYDPGDDFRNELQYIRTLNCNVLLEGGAGATAAVVALLMPQLRKPIIWTRPGAPLQFERGRTGTVILEAVSELGNEEQSRMLHWLDDATDRSQTISLTTTPLYPLVMQGLFTEALYYRLNSVLLRLGLDRRVATADR